MHKIYCLILTTIILLCSELTKAQMPKCPSRVINSLCRVPAREKEQSKINSNITTTDFIAPDGYYPWYSFIYHIDYPIKLVYRCAGSIIHSKVILTAGTCFDIAEIKSSKIVYEKKIPSKNLMVQVGTNRKEFGGNYLSVKSTTYIEPSLALIFLFYSIEFNAYTRPVCIHLNNINDVLASEHWVSNHLNVIFFFQQI